MVDVEGCQDGEREDQDGGEDVEAALCRVELHGSVARLFGSCGKVQTGPISGFVKLLLAWNGLFPLQRLLWPKAVELRSAGNDTRITADAIVSKFERKSG